MVVPGRALICASVNLHRGTGPGSSGNSSGRESRKQSYRLATDRDQRLTPSAVDYFLPRRNPVPHRPGTRSLRMPPHTSASHSFSRPRRLRQRYPGTRLRRVRDVVDELEHRMTVFAANFVIKLRRFPLFDFRARTSCSADTRHSIATRYRTARSPNHASGGYLQAIARRGGRCLWRGSCRIL
jgi:hypothetical protein